MSGAPRSAARFFACAALAIVTGIAGCNSNEPTVNDDDVDVVDDDDDDVEVPIPAGFRIALLEVASGLTNPIALTSPPGDARIFVAQQNGVIQVLSNGQLLPTPFLDISSRVGFDGEQGLLGLAFHPDFASNGYFYVNFSDRAAHTRVERFTVSPPSSNVANAASSSLVIEVDQPGGNHNGGMLLFAPDRTLFVALGDGGGHGDPQGHGQNTTTVLGSLLRLSLNGAPYSIPANNPFAQSATARREIWAYGLRNPWRIAIDRKEGILYVADVGQGRVEEVSAVPLAQPGVNFGWRVMEGNECYEATTCNQTGLTHPVLVYGRTSGCSVTGGFVYRGTAIPEIAGHYFYSDYCGGWIRSFRYVNGQATQQREWTVANVGRVIAFGEDFAGELYVLTETGRVHRIVRDD